VDLAIANKRRRRQAAQRRLTESNHSLVSNR
jgi:hypothetical protein